MSVTDTGRSESPGSRVRWGGVGVGVGDLQRPLEHQGVTPRRGGETQGSPKLRRKSVLTQDWAQDWSQEGARRLGQLGSQLGIGQRCKVHLKVSRA